MSDRLGPKGEEFGPFYQSTRVHWSGESNVGFEIVLSGRKIDPNYVEFKGRINKWPVESEATIEVKKIHDPC